MTYTCILSFWPQSVSLDSIDVINQPPSLTMGQHAVKKSYDRWTCTCNTWKIKSSYRLHIFSWYVIFLRFSYFTFFLFQNNSAGERIFLYTIWFLHFRIRAQIIQCVVPPTLNMRGKPPCTDSAEFNFAENQVVRRLTALQNACGAGNFYFDPQKIP